MMRGNHRRDEKKKLLDLELNLGFPGGGIIAEILAKSDIDSANRKNHFRDEQKNSATRN